MENKCILSFIKQYNVLLTESQHIDLSDVERHKNVQIKLKVLVRSFLNELAENNLMDFVDEFVQLYNDVWTNSYDEQYEKDKKIIA